MTDLSKTDIAALERATEREASMGLRKFFRLLRLRLHTQGFKATLLWMFNVFNRLVLDRPIRRQCEVTPQLFVGPQFKRNGWRQLRKWGISGVVNLRREFDDLSLGVNIPHYLHLPTTDDAPPTLEDLARGVDFIREMIEGGGKVYIHCGAGVGRAPTMAAAYLITLGDTPQQAYDRIRSNRQFIRPTAGQREQLQNFYNLHTKKQPPG
ncbi:MAG: protein-tyrosine phosphatase family protein [Bellilinea sp.]